MNLLTVLNIVATREYTKFEQFLPFHTVFKRRLFLIVFLIKSLILENLFSINVEKGKLVRFGKG